MQAALLGADVTICCKLGVDSYANELLAVCKAKHICTDYIIQESDESSGTALIVVEDCPGKDSVNRIIVVPGTNMRLTIDDILPLKDKISDYDMVILQLEIPMEINETIARWAHEKAVPVMLNSAPSMPLNDEFLSLLTYISPNEHEIEDMTGVHIAHTENKFSSTAALNAAHILLKKGVKNLIITMGSAGAVLINNDSFHHSPCVSNIEVVNPTAAGDSFVGAFCCGSCYGWSIDDILKFSNYSAAVTVSRFGAMAALPSLDSVKQLLSERNENHPIFSMVYEL